MRNSYGPNTNAILIGDPIELCQNKGIIYALYLFDLVPEYE